MAVGELGSGRCLQPDPCCCDLGWLCLAQSPLQSIAAGHPSLAMPLAVPQLLQGPCALAGNLYFD